MHFGTEVQMQREILLLVKTTAGLCVIFPCIYSKQIWLSPCMLPTALLGDLYFIKCTSRQPAKQGLWVTHNQGNTHEMYSILYLINDCYKPVKKMTFQSTVQDQTLTPKPSQDIHFWGMLDLPGAAVSFVPMLGKP